MPKAVLEVEVEQMFREDLIVACQYWNVDMSASPSGASLGKLLAAKMRKKQYRNRIFQTFSEGEQDLLGMLVLNGGALSYDRLKPYRKIYSYGQLNQTERDLRKRGIIIRKMMSRPTDHGREVAEFKILDFFVPHLMNLFSEKPTRDPEKPSKARNVVNERDTLLLDMLLLVSHIAKNEVYMTSSWEFPKRAIEHIKEAMSKPTEERFEMVQKLARKAGAYRIVQKDRVVPGNVQALFTGKLNQVSLRILLSSLGRTRAIWATPDQPTEYTLNLAICRLRESTQEEWIGIDEMRGWIRSELFVDNQPLKWIQVDDDRVRMALETPIRLGLVEAAFKGKRLQAVRLTSVGESVIRRRGPEEHEGHETFFVQPNFEVSVFSSEMNYSTLYQLMLLTEPVRTDVVSTFKITDRSIFQAIEIGHEQSDILEFLARESSKPIPDNVRRSIEDWISQTTFATISSVVLFETETERDLEDLMLLREFKRSVVRQVGPTAVIMEGDIVEITDRLRDHKCHVRHVGEERKEPQAAGVGAAEQMLLYGEQIGTDVPEDCEGCPAILSCNRVIRRKTKTRKTRGSKR